MHCAGGQLVLARDEGGEPRSCQGDLLSQWTNSSGAVGGALGDTAQRSDADSVQGGTNFLSSPARQAMAGLGIDGDGDAAGGNHNHSDSVSALEAMPPLHGELDFDECALQAEEEIARWRALRQ